MPCATEYINKVVGNKHNGELAIWHGIHRLMGMAYYPTNL
jgi:hypothetical protein